MVVHGPRLSARSHYGSLQIHSLPRPGRRIGGIRDRGGQTLSWAVGGGVRSAPGGRGNGTDHPGERAGAEDPLRRRRFAHRFVALWCRPDPAFVYR